MAAVAIKRGLMHLMAKKKIAALPEADKVFLNQLKTGSPDVTQPNIAQKVEELQKQRIVFEKVTTVNDEIHVSWVSY